MELWGLPSKASLPLTPIPCSGWSLLGCPHLMQQALLAHSLLQCKIRCEDRWGERQTERWRGRGKKVENQCDRWRKPLVGVGEFCLRPSTVGWRTHTPNHASAERVEWERIGGNETEDETPCWWAGLLALPARIRCSWKGQGRGAAHCCLGDPQGLDTAWIVWLYFFMLCKD